MDADDSRLIQAISLIVHDLKSPLSGIQGNAQYLERSSKLDDASREAVQDIVQGIRVMNRLVMNLLDVCRDEEDLQPRRHSIALRDLAAQVAKEFAYQARRRGQTIDLQVPEELTVLADGDLLRRIIENLVDNAVKYSARGGTIAIRAREVDNEVEICISDHADPIPIEYRDRVFKSGVRLDRDSLVHVGSSRGLGLAFCRRAVAAHGGSITVEEGIPCGNLFRIRLQAPAPERLPSP